MKNLVKSFGATVLFAIGTIIGLNAGEVIFEEKVGPWLKRKLSKNDD